MHDYFLIDFDEIWLKLSFYLETKSWKWTTRFDINSGLHSGKQIVKAKGQTDCTITPAKTSA